MGGFHFSHARLVSLRGVLSVNTSRKTALTEDPLHGLSPLLLIERHWIVLARAINLFLNQIQLLSIEAIIRCRSSTDTTQLG